jgi:hypothetical protein
MANLKPEHARLIRNVLRSVKEDIDRELPLTAANELRMAFEIVAQG